MKKIAEVESSSKFVSTQVKAAILERLFEKPNRFETPIPSPKKFWSVAFRLDSNSPFALSCPNDYVVMAKPHQGLCKGYGLTVEYPVSSG